MLIGGNGVQAWRYVNRTQMSFLPHNAYGVVLGALWVPYEGDHVPLHMVLMGTTTH